MPIEWDLQEKQINCSEHAFEKLCEQLLTTKLMGKLGVFAHVFNHRGKDRCMSLSWKRAWSLECVLGEEKSIY